MQEEFKNFLKTKFAPRMRDLGFKGTGQKYSFPNESSYIHIGVQKSQWASSSEISFTLNIQIIEKNEWSMAMEIDPHLPAKPSPLTAYALDETDRIGSYTPEAYDRWWDFNKRRNEEKIMNEIFGILEAYVIPKIKREN